MIESECPYLSPFGNRRRPAGIFFSSLDRRKEGKRRSRPLPRPGKMGRMCLIGERVSHSKDGTFRLVHFFICHFEKWFMFAPVTAAAEWIYII